MNTWIGIIGTLLGGIVGAGTTYPTANAHARRQMRWESIKLTQEKLEELAEVIDEVAHHYRKISGDALMRVQYGKQYESNGSRIPYSRLSMLTHFHAPELLPDLESLTSETNAYGEVLAETIRDVVRDTAQKQELNGRILKGADRIINKCESMSKRAAKVAIAHVEQLTANNSLQRTLDLSAIFARARKPGA